MSDQKNKIVITISGMHCRSCEMLIEDKLSEVPNVRRTVVNYKKGTAEIHYNEQKPDIGEIEKAIREAGYTVGYSGEKKPLLSRNPEDYKDLGISFIFLIGIYIILTNLGITSISVGSSASHASLPVVFLVGITAGLSTCMALVGGLILGISARHAEKHPEATPMQKFRPHLFFNAGRISSYAILGGVLGALGNVFQLSASTLGLLAIFVGIVMLMLGMKLVGIFPRMENGGITLPSGISKFLGIKKHTKEYSHKSSAITGALTFFLPCGFTQAMQLYAISTGSPLQGALIMGTFALGTAPGLLSVGGFTSVIKGIFAQRFFKFAGLLVIFLAMFNISNGLNLAGWQPGTLFSASSAQTALADDPNVKLENGAQVVNMTESGGGYSPAQFTIKKGVPVKWIIDAQAPNSCAGTIVVSTLGIRKSLQAGQNEIDFTPTDIGRIPFSCAMGMYTGVFNVVDDQGTGGSVAQASASTTAASTTPSGTCGGGASGGGCGGGGSTGGGCGGSGKAVTPTQGTVQSAPSADNSGANAQVINATYTYSKDIQPNTFTVKAGQPVKFLVDVQEDGQGCMSTIMVQGLYNQPQVLSKGSKLEMDFTPTKPGVYNITCAMGVPRGTITVQ